jgi:hypothetical protein
MSGHTLRTIVLPVALLWLSAGCGSHPAPESLLPAETFHWIRQPIAFAPPSSRWERQGDGGGGTTGVRFILRNGGGQCISVAAFRTFAERDSREALIRLRARVDSLSQREFLNAIAMARPRTDDPISSRESAANQAITNALDRATRDYLDGSMGFLSADLDAAVRAASEYEPTMAELLPHIRLRPDRMQNPEYWRIGYERDTLVAGVPAFASDDTLVLPEQTLLYHEIFWVVNGCAFKATFQGREDNLALFHRVVDSIQFPEPDAVAAR